jgi:hypothetical protein
MESVLTQTTVVSAPHPMFSPSEVAGDAGWSTIMDRKDVCASIS